MFATQTNPRRQDRRSTKNEPGGLSLLMRSGKIVRFRRKSWALAALFVDDPARAGPAVLLVPVRILGAKHKDFL
jgi:hypothetical protein